jgi:CDP-glucose 4,6-dehydratase
MGGLDPYSASKSCAEIAVAEYRYTFFQDGGAGIATVRAGNVIGGGDWAADRASFPMRFGPCRGEAHCI